MSCEGNIRFGLVVHSFVVSQVDLHSKVSLPPLWVLLDPETDVLVTKRRSALYFRFASSHSSGSAASEFSAMGPESNEAIRVIFDPSRSCTATSNGAKISCCGRGPAGTINPFPL